MVSRSEPFSVFYAANEIAHKSVIYKSSGENEYT